VWEGRVDSGAKPGSNAEMKIGIVVLFIYFWTAESKGTRRRRRTLSETDKRAFQGLVRLICLVVLRDVVDTWRLERR